MGASQDELSETRLRIDSLSTQLGQLQSQVRTHTDILTLTQADRH